MHVWKDADPELRHSLGETTARLRIKKKKKKKLRLPVELKTNSSQDPAASPFLCKKKRTENNKLGRFLFPAPFALLKTPFSCLYVTWQCPCTVWTRECELASYFSTQSVWLKDTGNVLSPAREAFEHRLLSVENVFLRYSITDIVRAEVEDESFRPQTRCTSLNSLSFLLCLPCRIFLFFYLFF